MRILAIETSCDETAAAIVEDGYKVLSNVIASQIQKHRETGGVVPEVAAREHVVKIIPVIDKALSEANSSWDEIDAVAAVKGPGLISALLTGTLTASTIALFKAKPLIPVHHILAHIYGNRLDRLEDFNFPLIVLTVSGGHNDLILMKDHAEFELLGSTRDDAAGEAFDKVAKLLGLEYPGGPSIQKAAEKGNEYVFKFPKADLGNSYDYSFSGLKTAVLYEIQNQFGKNYDPSKLPAKFVSDVSASFQRTVSETLIDTALKAVFEINPKEFHIAGGVSANKKLREYAENKLKDTNIKLKKPEKITYCTDNAAMVGSAAYFFFKKFPLEYKEWKNIEPMADFTF
jgi:N6-L-threonylcarbamoyladenine synthase